MSENPTTDAAEQQETAEARRQRRRNVITVSLPDALAELAAATGRDPEALGQAILDAQAPVIAARATEALRAVLP